MRQKNFQESEDSSKPEYIFGHMFGGLGILTGDLSKWFCTPLRFNIQDGLQQTSEWAGSATPLSSHVVQMVENGFHAAQTFGNSILPLDRYFLSVPALKKLAGLNCGSAVRMELVTKAKKSCCAYEKPAARRPGPDRPPVEPETVPGAPVRPCRIHFWTKAMPKLKKYRKKEEPHPLESVDDPKLRGRILRTVKAVEGFVQLCVIAMGILQITSLKFSGSIRDNIRYMRTPSKETVSEATFMVISGGIFFAFWQKIRIYQ